MGVVHDESDGTGSGTEVGEDGSPAASMTASGSEGMRTAGASPGMVASSGAGSPVDGAVEQSTTMNEDGSTTTVSIQADGTTVTTTLSPDGSEMTTVVAPDGTVIAAAGGGVAVTEPAIGRPVMAGMAIGPRGVPGGAVPGEPLDNCQPDYQGSGSQSCEIGLACDNGYVWSACYDNGDGWYCDCEGSGGWSQIQIPSGSELDDPCASVADVCADGVNVDANSNECTPSSEQADTRYCGLDFECRASIETDSGVSLDVLQYENVWCENTGTEWHCSCYQDNGSYDLTLAHEGTNVCQDVRELCLAGIDTDGDYQCERDYQSASAQWCDASLRCGQTANVDGLEVQVNGYLSVNCQPVEGEDAWQCYCGGLGVSDEFQVAGGDAWDTCSDAVLQCSDLVSGG